MYNTRKQDGGNYFTNKGVLESDFPNKDYKVTEENEKRFEEVSEKAVITDYSYKYNKSGNAEYIKRYIMKYGGVQICVEGSDKQWQKYKGGVYHSTDVKNSGDHAVTIIGWDDNYSKDNFVYEKPQNDGAWLIYI